DPRLFQLPQAIEGELQRRGATVDTQNDMFCPRHIVSLEEIKLAKVKIGSASAKVLSLDNFFQGSTSKEFPDYDRADTLDDHPNPCRNRTASNRVRPMLSHHGLLGAFMAGRLT